MSQFIPQPLPKPLGFVNRIESSKAPILTKDKYLVLKTTVVKTQSGLDYM